MTRPLMLSGLLAITIGCGGGASKPEEIGVRAPQVKPAKGCGNVLPGPFREGGYGFRVGEASGEVLDSGRTRCTVTLIPEGSASGSREIVIPWSGGGESGEIVPGPLEYRVPATVTFEIGPGVDRVSFDVPKLREREDRGAAKAPAPTPSGCANVEFDQRLRKVFSIVEASRSRSSCDYVLRAEMDLRSADFEWEVYDERGVRVTTGFGSLDRVRKGDLVEDSVSVRSSIAVHRVRVVAAL